MIVPQISSVVSSKGIRIPAARRSPTPKPLSPRGRTRLPGAYSRAQSALGDSMTIYQEMALSLIVAGLVVAIGRLIEMVFELVI